MPDEKPKRKSLEQIVLEAGDSVLKEKKPYQPGGTLAEEQVKLLLGDEPQKKKSLPSAGTETQKTPLLVDVPESEEPATTGSLKNTLSGDPSEIDFSKEPKIDNGFFSSENTKVNTGVNPNDKTRLEQIRVESDQGDIEVEKELAKIDNGLSRPMSYIGTFNQHAYGLPATILETVAMGGTYLSNNVTKPIMGWTEDAKVEDDPVYKIAQWYRDSIKELSPNNPAYEEELGTQASGALGDLATLILTGGGSRVPATLNELQQFTKASNIVVTGAKEAGKLIKTPPALVGAMQTGTNEYKQAKAMGASDDEAFGAFVKNAGVGGVLESIPVMKFFTRLDKTTGGGVRNYIKNSTVQGVEEMTTELAQQMFANVDAANTYDVTRKWYDGMTESGGIGFGLGFLLGGMGTSLRKKHAEAKTPEEKADIQKAIDFADAKGEELKLQEESKEAKIQAENARAEVNAAADPGTQQETVTPEQQVPVSEGVDTPADQSIIDLATRISQGETTFSPEELQLQANHPSEVEQALINLSQDTSGIKATEEAATIKDPALPEQVAVDDALPGKDVALASDRPSVETVKKAEPVEAPLSDEVGVKVYNSGRQQYTVKKSDGGIEIINEANGKIIDRKSKSYDKVLKQYKEDVIPTFKEGKRADVSEGMDDSQYVEAVIISSENPEEIASAFVSIPEGQLDQKDQAIKEHLRKLPFAGIKRFGDTNKIKGASQIKFNYVNNKGVPLDVQAQEISELAGVEITPQDIVDFIEKYPSGKNSAKADNSLRKGLADKFYKLTGMDLDEDYARKISAENKVYEKAVSELPEDLLDLVNSEGISASTIDQYKDQFFSGFPYTEEEFNLLKDHFNEQQRRESKEVREDVERPGIDSKSEQGSEGSIERRRDLQSIKDQARDARDSQDPEKAKAVVKEIDGILMRENIVSGDDASFADPSSPTFFDFLDQNKSVYLLDEDANIAQTPGQLQKIIDATPGAEDIEINNGLSFDDAFDSGVIDQAKKMGYDGIRMMEIDGTNSTLQIWNFDKLSHVDGPELVTKKPPVKPPVPPENKKPDKGGSKKQNTKSVYRNVIEKSKLDDDIKQRLKANDKYNVFTNEESSAIADAFISEYDSIDEAVDAAMKSNSGVHGAVKTMVLGKAITNITEEYNKSKTPEEKESLTDKQAEYIDLIDNLVREAGQTAQAVSAMYKATVLGMKKATEKKIEKYNDYIVEKNGLETPTEEKIAETFETAADQTLSDPAYKALEKQLEELNEKVKKLEDAAKEKKKAERETKRKNVKERLEKNKEKFKKIDWLGKGDVAMGSIIPIPLNPEKAKALASLAKDYIELGAIDAAEVYDKLNAYIKEVTKGKGFLEEKDFERIYKEAEKRSDLDLKKKINQEIKKEKVKFNELVRAHFSDRETALHSIKDKILESYPGLDKSQVDQFSKKIDAIFKDKLVKEQVKQISKSHSSAIKNITTNQKEKNENTAKKLVKEINLGNVDSDFYIELWKERHGLINTNNKEIRSTINDLIAKIHRSTDGQLKNRAETELLDYIASMQKKALIKMGISAAYGNMLSSYQSHLNNMVYGSTAVAKQIVKRAIPTRKNYAAINVALKGFRNAVVEVRDILKTGYRDQGSEYVKESDALIKGNKFMQAISLAFRGLAAEDAFFNRPLTDMMEFEGLYDKAIAQEVEKRKDPHYKRKENKEIIKELNKQFIGDFNKHQAIKKEAAKDVEASEGLDKPLFVEKNVDYKDSNGNTQTKAVLERNPEYSNVKYNKYYRLQKMRAFEIAEQKRDASGNVKKEAREWANDQLLIGTPKGDAGIIARMINDTLGLDAPIAKMAMVPFVNVPLNSFNLLVETSPYGTLTLGTKYIHQLVTGKPMKETLFFTGGAERRGIDPMMTRKRKTQLLQRQALFYSTAIALYSLSKMTYTDDDGEEKPILEVTADGKKNWLKNEQLKKGTGEYKEYTFTLNWPVKYQFSYKYTPFAGILAPLGKVMDYEKYEVKDPKKEVSLGKKLSLVMFSYGSFMIDAASLKGLSDAFNFNTQDFDRAKDEEAWLETTMRNMGKSLAKQLQSKGIPFSGLLKAANEDISGIMEADDHQANEWYEYMMRDIPVLDQMLDFKYDHLGRPVKSVADVPVLWNGNYKKDDYYKVCQKFDYENKFYNKYNITDPEDSDNQAELNYRDLTVLNKDRGEIANKMLYEEGMLEQITEESKQEETEYQQNKYFKEEMDRIFKEATEEAKILYFNKKAPKTE